MQVSTVGSTLTVFAEKLVAATADLDQQCAQLKVVLSEQRDFIRSMEQEVQDCNRLLTIREAAKLLGVGYDTVIAWVNWKEIEAINVSKRRGGRARWRIAPAELRRFLQSRTHFRKDPQPPRRSRRQPTKNFVRHFR